MLLATYSTFQVIRSHFAYLNEQELALYTLHFAPHGLSKREFHTLIKRSGMEWHRGGGGGGGGGNAQLTTEGPVNLNV